MFVDRLFAFYRPAKKSNWICRCNRENRHRGLCNSRATIPGTEAYSQNTEPASEKQQSAAGVTAQLKILSSFTECNAIMGMASASEHIQQHVHKALLLVAALAAHPLPR